MTRSVVLLFVLMALSPIAFCQSAYTSVTNTIRFGSHQISKGGMSVCSGRGVCTVAAQQAKGPGAVLNTTITFQPKQNPRKFLLQCIFQVAKDSLNFQPDRGDSTYTFDHDFAIPASWLNGIKNAKVCKGTVAQLTEPSDPAQNMVLIIPFLRGKCACHIKKKK